MDTDSVLALVLFPVAMLIVGQLVRWRVAAAEAAVATARDVPAVSGSESASLVA